MIPMIITPNSFPSNNTSTRIFFDDLDKEIQFCGILRNLSEEYEFASMLSPATQSNKFFSFAKQLDLDFAAYSNISILKTDPMLKMRLHSIISELKQSEQYRTKKTSTCDCILGIYSYLFKIGIISYDTDIYDHLQKKLGFEAFWAFDVVRLAKKGTYILDTNVLIYLLDRKNNHVDMIRELFTIKGIQLIIPDLVFTEFFHFQEKSAKAKKQAKIMSRRAHYENQMDSRSQRTRFVKKPKNRN